MRAAACAWLIAAPLAACGPGAAPDANQTAPVQTATPVGLYEIRTADGLSQLCVAGEGAALRFGLVLHGPAGACGGSGRAEPTATGVRLEMTGDEACAIDARFLDRRIAFPGDLPSGCAYYCAPGARLAGAVFDKVGGADADAARARDPVGDPLC